MGIEPPHLQLLLARVVVVRGEAGGRRHHVVAQRRAEERRGGGAGREVQAVEVVEGVQRGVDPAALAREVAGEFAVRPAVRDLDGAADVGQERYVDQRARQAGDQPRRRQGRGAALAAAGDHDPAGVHRRVPACHLHGPYRVGEQPPVVVVLGAQQPLGHLAGHARIAGAGRIGGVTGPVGAALPTGVHDERGVPRGRPQQPVVRHPPAAAVAEVLHDAGQRPVRRARQEEPAADTVPAEAGERHVMGAQQRQPRIDLGEACVEVMGADFVEGALPERVEAGRLGARRAVGVQLVQGQVGEHEEPPRRRVACCLSPTVPTGRIFQTRNVPGWSPRP